MVKLSLNIPTREVLRAAGVKYFDIMRIIQDAVGRVYGDNNDVLPDYNVCDYTRWTFAKHCQQLEFVRTKKENTQKMIGCAACHETAATHNIFSDIQSKTPTCTSQPKNCTRSPDSLTCCHTDNAGPYLQMEFLMTTFIALGIQSQDDVYPKILGLRCLGLLLFYIDRCRNSIHWHRERDTGHIGFLRIRQIFGEEIIQCEQASGIGRITETSAKYVQEYCRVRAMHILIEIQTRLQEISEIEPSAQSFHTYKQMMLACPDVREVVHEKLPHIDELIGLPKQLTGE